LANKVNFLDQLIYLRQFSHEAIVAFCAVNFKY